MDGGGGRGMKSKNVVEMNRYPHKQNCNKSISMELSKIYIYNSFLGSLTLLVVMLSSCHQCQKMRNLFFFFVFSRQRSNQTKIIKCH